MKETWFGVMTTAPARGTCSTPSKRMRKSPRAAARTPGRHASRNQKGTGRTVSS